jgi:hypothetical protein
MARTKQRLADVRTLKSGEQVGGVFLAYLHPNHVSSSFVDSLDMLRAYDASGPQQLRRWGKVRAGHQGLVDGRNQIARDFVDSPCEWLFFLDADMGFAPDMLERLMAAAHPAHRPIVGALAFAYREFGMDGMGGYRAQPLPTIFEYVEHPDGQARFTGRKHYPVNQLVKTAATGASCILIHRSVFERIAEHPTTAGKGEPFDRIMGADGLMGEDISFCMRAGALDIPIFVHTGVRSTHHKELWVAETDFWTSFNAPPARERVDVVVPTVKPRVGNLPALVESLVASTGRAHLWFVLDDNEHRDQVVAIMDELDVADWSFTIEPGSFAHKINTVYPLTTAPWIKVVGDDCRFHPGWLDHAQHVARLYGAKVVGSNDLANPRVMSGDHATHWMVARDYIDEVGASWDGPGVVAHEGYRHWFTDDEIVAAARQRGVFQMALGSVVEHFHPMTGKAETDEVYERSDGFAEADRKLFERRVRENLGGRVA